MHHMAQANVPALPNLDTFADLPFERIFQEFFALFRLEVGGRNVLV